MEGRGGRVGREGGEEGRAVGALFKMSDTDASDDKRMEAVENFLQCEGGSTVSATTQEEALTQLRQKMSLHPHLFSPEQVPHVLWTLELFAKTEEELLLAFLAYAAVRGEAAVPSTAEPAPAGAAGGVEGGAEGGERDASEEEMLGGAGGGAGGTKERGNSRRGGRIRGYDCELAFRRLLVYAQVLFTHTYQDTHIRTHI